MINKIQLIPYAGDVTVMANEKVTLMKAIKRLDKEANECGNEINKSKIKT